VFDRYRDGVTIGGALDRLGDVGFGEPATQGAVEEAVLDLLEESDSPALEKVA
jgi:DNA topoisomerase I